MENRAASHKPSHVPERTCVGCRGRAVKSELLRVVVVSTEIQTELVPDPSGRLPGRGAYVHQSTTCLDLAERRRAFSRALRVAGPLELCHVRRWVEQQTALPGTGFAELADEGDTT